MDWLFLLVLFLVGILIVSYLPNPRNRSRTLTQTGEGRPHTRQSIIDHLIEIPRDRAVNGNVVDETIETYNRSTDPQGHALRDIVRRIEANPALGQLNYLGQRRTTNINNDNNNVNRCYVNWRNVEGDDEAVPENENEDNGEIGTNLQCKVCFINKINTVFMPCFHAAVCIACANRLQETKVCPICRNRIDTPRRIFL